MLGARTLEHYRLGYITDVSAWLPNAVECHKMVRLLNAGTSTRPASRRSPACLCPAASEDWWFLKQWANTKNKVNSAFFYLHLADATVNTGVANELDDATRFLTQDRSRGYAARNALENLLTRNGIPYKAAFVDDKDNIKDLKRFKVLVMPFMYSLSQEAFAEIQAAVEAGSQLIIFEQLAPTDEIGNAYEAPLLEVVAGTQERRFHQGSRLRPRGVPSDKISSQWSKLLDGAVAPSGFQFHANGRRSYVVTEIPGADAYLLYVGNWSKSQTARPLISLPASAGLARTTGQSGEEGYRDRCARRQGFFSAETLKGFDIEFAPAEVKLIRLSK